MKDLKRISLLAILLIIVLRISIGWQLLYEGMWKYDQMDGPKPWTSEGYLKNSQGPFRDHFREMTGDPDDLNWLNYAKMSKKWYDWRNSFVSHYKLNEEQKTLLNLMLDGNAEEDTAPAEEPPGISFSRTLATLPESVDLKKYKPTVVYDAKTKKLTVLQAVLPSEESKIKDMVDVVATGKNDLPYIKKKADDAPEDAPDVPAEETEAAFYITFDALVKYSRTPVDRQIGDLAALAKKKDSSIDAENFNYAASRINSTVKKALPYRQRLAASLEGDPERTGVFGELNEVGKFIIEMGTVTRQEESGEKHNIKFGKIKEYKELLAEYETALNQASMSYQYDHATMLAKKVAIMKADLTGPIKAMEKELQDNALKILTPEQLQLGNPPPADTPLHRADMAAMWGLLILGTLLIIGFFTRFAAVMAAVMVLSFYLVIPPWPGVPPAPGPEHSLYVNKNMIEVIALLCIALLPTGTWFGVDAFFSSMFFKKKEAE